MYLQVLQERQKQVDERMQTLLHKQQESIEEREDLINRMENYQHTLAKEKEEDVQRRKEREQEIQQQVFV